MLTVYIDTGVFIASPERTGNTRLCEVMARHCIDEGTFYVCPIDEKTGKPTSTPLYVRRKWLASEPTERTFPEDVQS